MKAKRKELLIEIKNSIYKNGKRIPIEERSGVFTSSSLAKLYRDYKRHVVDAVTDGYPILSLIEFYSIMHGRKEIPKCTAFEKYITKLNMRETTHESK